MAAGTYHHGDLAAALVQTAIDQARRAGPDGVVVREAARTVGVSHNAAYRHFRDREALLAQVAEATLEQMAQAMRRVLSEVDAAGGSGPPDLAILRLRALGRAYVEFAVAEPGLFRTAFRAAFEQDEVTSASPYLLLAEALEDLVTSGVIGHDQLEGMLMLCWSAVHGLALLLLDGPLESLPEADRERGLEAMLDQVEYGLRARRLSVGS